MWDSDNSLCHTYSNSNIWESTLTSLVHQIPFKCQKHAFSTPFQLWMASLRFSFPLLYTLHGGARLRAGIWWKKGSFLLFWISCFCRLLREGVGWPQHSPLSRTGLTTLVWPCCALLLRSALLCYGTLSTQRGMTFDVPVLWISILFTPTVILFLGTEPAL